VRGFAARLLTQAAVSAMALFYCARELAAEACPYANICETCENFLPADEFLPALRAQITDVRELRDDAATRGWDSEVARHQRVINSLEKHLHRLENTPTKA